MTNNVILALDAVAAVHVAREARDLERLAAIVALHERDQLRGGLALIEQPADAQHRLQPESDLGLHIRELPLEELRLRDRTPELHALHSVVARAYPAILGRAHDAPRDAVASAVQAFERALQSRNAGKQRLLGYLDSVHDDLARHGGAQRQLSADLRCRESLQSLLEDEAANRTAVSARLRPDNEHVGKRTVGDPRLRAAQPVASRGFLRARGKA